LSEFHAAVLQWKPLLSSLLSRWWLNYSEVIWVSYL